MGNCNLKVTGADLAILLGIHERTIRKLVTERVLKHLPNDLFDVGDCFQAYLGHREAIISAEHGQGEYGAARALLYQERAKVARMKREELEKTLISVDAVFRTWTALVTVVRQRLLNIPPKLAPRLLGQRHAADVQRLLTEEVHEALEELSRMKVRRPNAEEDEEDGPEDI